MRIQKEQGVPVPQPHARPSASGLIAGLEVGESLFFPEDRYARVYNLAYLVRYHWPEGCPKPTFATRTVEGGVRVWRTA